MIYTDDIATKALQKGDKKALTWIYNKYFHQLCFYAEKIVEDMETDRDIVHDLFTKLWENREKIDINTSLKAYLYGCVRNNCLKILEHIKVRREYEDSYLEENRDSHDSNNPETQLIVKETNSRIKETINTLPEQCRIVFLMRWKEGLKYEEIAEKSGISIGTVKTQISRARTKIKKTFGSNR